MLSPTPLRNLRTALTLSIALSVTAGTSNVLAAVNQGPLSKAAGDISQQIADLDKQMHEISTAPVDFCDPQAVRQQVRDWTIKDFEKLDLIHQLEKTHPTVQESVRRVVKTMADNGDLAVNPPIVEQYYAASNRGDVTGATGLLNRMSPFEQSTVAGSKHDYLLQVRLLTPLAEKGDARAQAEVLKLYTWDYGPAPKWPVPKDDAMAFKYAHELAQNGNLFGQQQTAKAYACGLGTAKDAVHAYAWFSLAAGQSAVGLRTYYEPEDILRKRDFMAATMSHEDVLRARRLTVRCFNSGYKACD